VTRPAEGDEGEPVAGAGRETLVPPVLARTPLSWLAVFGPGAVVASLTIGTGELVFSARAGSLFGFGVLWLFLLTCVLKWVLLYGAARHMVLSGVHPVTRYAALPGPRAWFPLVLLILAAGAFPIWVGFVAGVLGTLLEAQLGLDSHLWGIGATLLALGLVLRGGYETLERVQLLVVAALLAAVTASLLLLHVDWLAAARGLLLPGPLRYPEWLPAAAPGLAARPVWLEAATYVGVIGGSGYDYLAYVAFLRNKGWGLSSQPVWSSEALDRLGQREGAVLRRWLIAPLVDTGISFAVVLLFSAVFVCSGAIVLGPRQQVPAGGDLLTLQAQFVTTLHPALLPLYVTGALLAIAGTLYGTLAVAPAVIGEIVDTLRQRPAAERPAVVDRAILLWAGGGGVAVLVWSSLYRLWGGVGAHPPTLVEIVTPANLFTGVVSCGCICLLNLWQDRFLPRALRMPPAMTALSVLAGLFFLGLGLRGYWDFGAERFPRAGGGWLGAGVLLATLLTGWLAAWILARPATSRPNPPPSG